MPNRNESYPALCALRSFLPERTIIFHTDDIDARLALAMKYEAQSAPNIVTARILAIAAFARLKPRIQKPGEWTPVSRGWIESEAPSPIAAQDPDRGVSLERGSLDATFLHTDDITGGNDARQQLAAAAEHIANDPNMSKTPLVVGASYGELTSFGIRMGMRKLEITDIDRKFEAHLRASHTWTFINSKTPREFKPAAVYLPTKEFIETFREHTPGTA